MKLSSSTDGQKAGNLFDPAAAARRLARAWRRRELIDRLNANEHPADLDDGYAIQDRLAAELAEPIGGFKLALASQSAMRWSGLGHPVYGFMARSRMYANGATLPPIQSGKFLIEAEIAFVVGDHVAEQLPEDLRAPISSAHLAFEIVRSRFVDWAILGVPSFVADSLGFEGFVLGDELPGDISTADIYAAASVTKDGIGVASSLSGRDRTDPLASLDFFLASAKARRIELRPGMVITTGNIVSSLVTDQPGHYQAHLGDAQVSVSVAR